MRVILFNWKTISCYFENYAKVEEFINKVVYFLKSNKVDFFYVRLFENNKYIAKIRIKDNKCNQKILNLLHYNISNFSLTDDYQPEIKRYGGKHNVKHIERIFCVSSNITSNQLSNKDIVPRILLSIKLNTIIFDELELTTEVLKEMYSHLSETWLIYSSNVLNLKINNIDSVAKSLKRYINQYKFDFSDPYYQQYKESIYSLKKLNFHDYGQENPLYSDGLKKFIVNRRINKPFLNVIISLAHMNFNRLGIYPHIESTVYKMLSKNL